MLIHEATLEEGMEESALEKKHSTTKQAIKVGEKSGAWRLILTHFSPSHGKFIKMRQKYFRSKAKPFFAFDHSRISMTELEWAYTSSPMINDKFNRLKDK